MEKNFKSCCDLDLGPTMPNFELVRDIFIYSVFKCHVSRLNTFGVIMQKRARIHTHTHTVSDEYSTVVFCKCTTIDSNNTNNNASGAKTLEQN